MADLKRRPASDAKIGEFRATCKRLREDHKDRTAHGLEEWCNETFTDAATAEAHMKAVHPKKFRERPKGSFQPVPLWSGRAARPAVKPENQKVTPGTLFRHNGHTCQIVGHVSVANVRFLAWLPEGESPRTDKYLVWNHGADPETGLIMRELVAPAEMVRKAVEESSDEE